jgi:codanin-1
MRVIGKFIGFVVSRSYSYEGYRNSLVDQQQMSIRNLVSTRRALKTAAALIKISPVAQIHPDFDVKSIVLRAIDGRKLLVTIPWLVEYLAMLDFITIRLDYYRELFRILYTVYMGVNGAFCIMPQSKFIVRTCLGWLFEHPSIPEDYFNASMMLPNLHSSSDDSSSTIDGPCDELNPHLEAIIQAACPFLADFRVSMMPQRNRTTKAVSRTGRYRHITTKIQDKAASTATTASSSNHERLVEAFLASQSLSVRKIVDFTIDRASSAVIKDFQVRHLLAARKDARSAVESEVPAAATVEALKKRMRDIFQHHLERLHGLWNEDVPANCAKRVQAAFDALLPIETLNDVKKTLISITIGKTSERLQHWRATNISLEIFSKDIHVDATKLKESTHQQAEGGTSNRRTSQNMIIDLSAQQHQPSDYFQALQIFLHRASRHAGGLRTDELLQLLEMSVGVLDKQTLPSNAYRNVAFYLLQLVLLLGECTYLLLQDLQSTFH